MIHDWDEGRVSTGMTFLPVHRAGILLKIMPDYTVYPYKTVRKGLTGKQPSIPVVTIMFIPLLTVNNIDLPVITLTLSHFYFYIKSLGFVEKYKIELTTYKESVMLDQSHIVTKALTYERAAKFPPPEVKQRQMFFS